MKVALVSFIKASPKRKKEKRKQPGVVLSLVDQKKKKRGGFSVTDDDDCICITLYVLGTNLLNNQPVAVKFEPRKTDAPQLRDEYRAYKILAGSPGVPYAHYYVSMRPEFSLSSSSFACMVQGQEGLHNVLVIDLLGSSLEDLFDTCSRQFTVKTVAMLAKEMVSAETKPAQSVCMI